MGKAYSGPKLMTKRPPNALYTVVRLYRDAVLVRKSLGAYINSNQDKGPSGFELMERLVKDADIKLQDSSISASKPFP